MRNLSIALLALTLCGICKPCRAQFIGYASGQTVTQSLTVHYTAGSQAQTIALRNFGQVGHSMGVTWTTGDPTCTILLEGSVGSTAPVVLNAIPFQAGDTLSTRIGFSSGWFPQLSIVINPSGNAFCAADVNISYVGYQVPIPINPVALPYIVNNVQTPVKINGLVSIQTPQIVTNFTCYNPNNAVAFLQLFNSTTVPTLGTANFEVGIPAQSSYTYNGPGGIVFRTIAWAGAATTAGGNTQMGTALNCTFMNNVYGPFAPLVTWPL